MYMYMYTKRSRYMYHYYKLSPPVHYRTKRNCCNTEEVHCNIMCILLHKVNAALGSHPLKEEHIRTVECLLHNVSSAVRGVERAYG